MIIVKCDRCEKEIGDLNDVRGDGMTCGYYAECWQEFMDDDEHDVCDECMWADSRYIAVYGNVA
jgi:hypothetical protein